MPLTMVTTAAKSGRCISDRRGRRQRGSSIGHAVDAIARQSVGRRDGRRAKNAARSRPVARGTEQERTQWIIEI